MNKRPICPICIKNDAWINMFGNWICGECVSIWNKRNNELQFNNLKNIMKDGD